MVQRFPTGLSWWQTKQRYLQKNLQQVFSCRWVRRYSGEDKTSVDSLGGDFSINNALNPKNLGAKWKLLISRFQKSSWMLDLELNWPRYDRETKPNFSLKFMFLSYSYKFRSIDSFETFYNSSWVQFFCHISVNLAPNVTSRESFGI